MGVFLLTPARAPLGGLSGEVEFAGSTELVRFGDPARNVGRQTRLELGGGAELYEYTSGAR